VYLAAYGFTTLGVFAVVAWVGRRDDERVLVREWAGLARTRPAVALAMTVLLLSLAGVPPTAVFFGKFLRVPCSHAEPGSGLAGGGGRAQ